MGLRLIRQKSDTPSVRNIDDTRMARYAYGNYNGVIKSYGTELSASSEGNTFKIGSGCVVLDGWETEFDANGWSFAVDNVDTLRYYSVYLEVNLATETTRIVPLYDSASYPVVEKGDDLTEQTTGTAKLLLYRFKAQGGIISNVEAQFTTLEYARARIEAIEERLTRLGFKKGRCEISPSAGDPSLLPITTVNEIVKIGTNVYINLVINYDEYNEWTKAYSYGTDPQVIATIPIEFAPDRNIVFESAVKYKADILRSATFELKPTGEIFYIEGGSYGGLFYNIGGAHLNVGYCIVDPSTYEKL